MTTIDITTALELLDDVLDGEYVDRCPYPLYSICRSALERAA